MVPWKTETCDAKQPPQDTDRPDPSPLDRQVSPHLSYLLEGLGVKVGEDVAVGLGEDLEGDSAVMVLQRRDVVVPDGKFGSGVDLIPETNVGSKGKKEKQTLAH